MGTGHRLPARGRRAALATDSPVALEGPSSPQPSEAPTQVVRESGSFPPAARTRLPCGRASSAGRPQLLGFQQERPRPPQPAVVPSLLPSVRRIHPAGWSVPCRPGPRLVLERRHPGALPPWRLPVGSIPLIMRSASRTHGAAASWSQAVLSKSPNHIRMSGKRRDFHFTALLARALASYLTPENTVINNVIGCNL